MCTKEDREMALGHLAAVPVMKWQQFQARLKEEVMVLLRLDRKLVQDVQTDLTAGFPSPERMCTFQPENSLWVA